MSPATSPLNQLHSELDLPNLFMENQHAHDADLPIEDAADILEDFWKLPDEIRFCSGENECCIDDSYDGLFDFDENSLEPKVINYLNPYCIMN